MVVAGNSCFLLDEGCELLVAASCLVVGGCWYEAYSPVVAIQFFFDIYSLAKLQSLRRTHDELPCCTEENKRREKKETPNHEESFLYITPHLLRFLPSRLLNNKQLKAQEM